MAPIAIAVMLARVLPTAPVYTNEEEVYFLEDAGKPAPPWLGLTGDGMHWTAVDAFGAPVPNAPAYKVVAEADLLKVTLPDGRVTALRRARPVTCWAATRRGHPKPDGKEDWTFQAGLHMHDQGGRARVGGDGAPTAVIRMRNVVWPGGGNRPSLVLYIHTPDAPDHAVSYAWADPAAARVGVNLRWIQASCSVDGRDAPASRGAQP